MIRFPNAKINLGLYIERRRPDGYHDISTVFYPVPLCDVVEVVPSDEVRLFTYGNPVNCPPEKNLVMKAYRLLADEFNLPPVDIYLHKHIPDGAGLGGGSSDASSVLLILRELFSLPLSDEELAARAAKLGADCPFFIYNRPMAARGIGDQFTPTEVDLSGKYIVIVKPEVSVPTAEAYAGVTPQEPQEAVEDIVADDITTWKERLANDFESSIFPKHQTLADIKQSLYDAGAVYAAMSGSGSAIFGLFDSDKMADAFAAKCNLPFVFSHKL